MRSNACSFALSLFVLASGCYQQNLKVDVHEDGAGTIRLVERIVSKDARAFESAPEAERSDRLRGLLVGELASWDGLCAWTDAAARIEKDAIVFEAKGYFVDVRKLTRDGADGLRHRFDLRADDAITALSWSLTRRDEPVMNTLERCRAIVASLRSTRIEATITLPSALMAADGAPEPGSSTATWVLFSGVELEEELRALEARLEAGSITERDLVAAVRAKLEHRITARCRSGESSEVRDAFLEELESERARYTGSDLAREIERAKETRSSLRHGEDVQ